MNPTAPAGRVNMRKSAIVSTLLESGDNKLVLSFDAQRARYE